MWTNVQAADITPMTPSSAGRGATEARERTFAATLENLGAGRVAVTVTGELDLATVPVLRKRLAEAANARPEGLVVDLLGVSFIDSISIAAIVNTSRALPDARVAVAVEADSFPMLIFDVAGLDAVVDVFHSRHEAVAHARR
jgi:anti-sigma B factor antagonist